MVAELRERLSVSKQENLKCEIGSFELSRLNHVEVAVPYLYELHRLHSTGYNEQKIINSE